MYERPDFIETRELTESQQKLCSALNRMAEGLSHYGTNAVADAIQNMIDEAVKAALGEKKDD